MAPKNILVVAVDGLRASALGAYGNTSFATNALDELASQSLVADSCYAQSFELPLIYRALWRSLDPLRPDDPATDQSLIDAVNRLGYRTSLVTDEPGVKNLATEFAEVLELENRSNRRAVDSGETALAQLFAAAGEHALSATEQPQFVWVHSRGMHGPWDAPIDLQVRFLDEDDPPPVDILDPPQLLLTEQDDPDAAFRFSCAYGAQVMVLDEALGELMGAVDAASRKEWQVMLLGLRGFNLGEHGRIGGEGLYRSNLHVPWLIRSSDGSGRLLRTQMLATHADLFPTLRSWLERDQEEALSGDGRNLFAMIDGTVCNREYVISSDQEGKHAIHTSLWSMLMTASEEDGDPGTSDRSTAQLFIQPDDRWQANDIAVLRSEIVDGLAELIRRNADALQHGRANPPLDDELKIDPA